MSQKRPSEIARETLLSLTTRRLPPTPLNYQAVYNEIAGTPNAVPFPEEDLRRIARVLPAKSAAQDRQKELLERAVSQQSWASVQDALVAYLRADAGAADDGAKTAEGNRAPPAPGGIEIAELVARLIENSLPAMGAEDARFFDQAAELLKALRASATDVAKLKSLLGNFAHRLSFVAEDQAEIKGTLLRLLHLSIENLSDLGPGERWLEPQVNALAQAATPPLTLRRLDDLERRLKDVLYKQIEAKSRALEAQDEMRRMLAVFIERLALMAESTSAYHNKMEESARQIEQAGSINEMAPVLKGVISATRAIAEDIRVVRDELRDMREKVVESEEQIAKLRQELDATSAQARHDTLTGALNRRGLDEAMQREVADVRRRGTPLCVALLDIDNFKKLNDTRGHRTGDVALIHLAEVTRECMRAQDTLARYGGEEFVILMPDTTLENGIATMTRLQRALTRRYFLAGAEQMLITFSAGVALLSGSESGEDAIKRADQAMFRAKLAGKNRVIGA